MSGETQAQDRHFEIGGLRLHYLDRGNVAARPLVLLHGLQECARAWDPFASAMATAYHVLALDHRGHGDSDWAGPGRYRLCDYVSDVEGLVDHLALRDIVLVGHSAGGRTAIMYAASRPESVEALVVVDTDPDPVNLESQRLFRLHLADPDDWESLDSVVRGLRDLQPNSTEEALVHQAVHMTRKMPDGRRVWKRDRRLVEAYERPDLWAEWSGLRCPTLIVRGRQSDLLTHEMAVKMKEAIPRVRLAELEGGGHWIHQEFPGAFEATVRWFLEEPPAR